MIISDFFRNDYKLILSDEKIDKDLDFFLDEHNNLSKPLEKVYMHNTQGEMFLILNCMDLDESMIKYYVNEWEKNILSFSNFSKVYKDKMYYLKYNTTLLILCKENDIDNKDEYQYETEKSIKICKKIFLYCNEDGEILENEKQLIPFYFESIQVDQSQEILVHENLLNSYLSILPEIINVKESNDKYNEIDVIIRRKI